jgi:hypothetical protein
MERPCTHVTQRAIKISHTHRVHVKWCSGTVVSPLMRQHSGYLDEPNERQSHPVVMISTWENSDITDGQLIFVIEEICSHPSVKRKDY